MVNTFQYDRELEEDVLMFKHSSVASLKHWSEMTVQTIYKLTAIDADIDLIEHFRHQYDLIQNELNNRND